MKKHADLIHDIEKSVDGGQTFPQMQSVLCIYGACITHIHETIKLQIKIICSGLYD